HTPPTGTSASRSSPAGLSTRLSTPWASGRLLARRLAILASVLVGARPMDTGMPVHWRTVARMWRAKAVISPVWRGIRPGVQAADGEGDADALAPRNSRNASSMEYTSIAGVN